MGRTLKYIVALTVVAGVFGAMETKAPAQDRARTSRAQQKFAPRKAKKRRPRPQPNALRQERISPQLLRILEQWAAATGGSRIKILEGQVIRLTYEATYMVEMRSKGEFYFVAPDKGLFTLRPEKISPGDKSKKKDRKTGRRYTLKPDQGERWIVTGKVIWKIDDKNKTADGLPIPPSAQNENIMDGPLPFLLGMPADKARLRYRFQLLPTPKDKPKSQIWLNVWPKWEHDARNWSKAKVILSRPSFLPVAVRLTDAAGNKSETVYVFQNMKINQKPKFWKGDPFKVKFPRDYTVTMKDIFTLVPDVIGLPWKHAAAKIKKSGFKIKAYRGKPASKADRPGIVYKQVPEKGKKLVERQTITVTVFGPHTRKAAKLPRSGQRTAAQ